MNKKIKKVIIGIGVLFLIYIDIIGVKFIFWYTTEYFPHKKTIENPQTVVEEIYAFPYIYYSRKVQEKNQISAHYGFSKMEEYTGECNNNLSTICDKYQLKISDKLYIYIYDDKGTYIPMYALEFDDEKKEVYLYVYSDSFIFSLLLKTVSYEDFNKFYENEKNNSKYLLVDEMVRTIRNTIHDNQEEIKKEIDLNFIKSK